MPAYSSWAGFFVSFYIFHEYASKSNEYPFNGNYKYPSYVIAKEKFFKPLAAFDLEAIQFSDFAKEYFTELKKEVTRKWSYQILIYWTWIFFNFLYKKLTDYKWKERKTIEKNKNKLKIKPFFPYSTFGLEDCCLLFL